MNILKKSIVHKAGVFTGGAFLLLAVLGAVGSRLFSHEIPTSLFFVGIVLILGIAFGLFLVYIAFPLHELSKEVHSLLSGARYQRVPPKSVDEIGLMAHFFNEITINLEKISSDIKQGRALGEEMELAAEIQRDVLPKTAPDMIGLDITARSKSARQIGGDSFDFIKKEQNDFISIGDATGHGIPAALVMMIVSTLTRTYLEMGMKTAEAMCKVNDFLFEKISANRFMTLVLLRWDEAHQKMHVTGAGHETVLIYRQKTKKVESLKSGGIALHMIPNIEKMILEREIPDFEEGDTILLYTDGITEAKNTHTGEMFGLSRLIASFERNGHLSTSELIFEKVTNDFAAYVGNYLQNDDITMIVMKHQGVHGKGSKISLSLPDTSSEIVASGTWSWE